MNNGGASSHADTLIGQWKVIYMGGIPGYYGIKGRSYISLLHEGFYITSDQIGVHYFSYGQVLNWNIVKERSAFATASSNASFGPRHIRIEYIDAQGEKNVILLEMVQSVFLPKSAKHCQIMMATMAQHGIFEKFYRAPQH